MKVLCLVDKYYPEASANTVCADIIMNYFKGQGEKVDFVSILQAGNNDLFSVYNDSNVIKIQLNDYYSEYLRKYGKKFNARNWGEFPFWFRKIVALKSRIFRPFRPFTGYNSLDCVNYKTIYNQIKKVCEQYDIVVSFSMPFALHLIARKLKKIGIAKKWFPIFLDPFVNNKTLSQKRLKIKYRQYISKKILKDAEKIFMVRGIVEENLNQKFIPKYHNNVVEIDLPNLIEKIVPERSNNDDKIHIIYAGLFYKDIRNPEKMLDILSKLPKDFNINMYGQGCESIVEKKMLLFQNATINYFGKVDYTRAQEEILKSNILINLGNKITNQTPSKVFEYIGFKKPILNFYFDEKDTSLYYLKRYPLALNINLNTYNENDFNKIINFCRENKNKKLTFEELTVNLQENISSKICEKIYKIINN